MTTIAEVDTEQASPWENPAHDSWLGVSSRFGRFVSTVSGRTDLIAHVAPDTRPDDEQEKRPHPIACFIPALAEVRFTATKIWDMSVDPATVDPNDGLDRARHPQMVGAACHEAAHAAHTRLTFDKGSDPAARRWAVLLEEPRIEGRLVARRAADRVWLRASAIQLCSDGALSLPRGETPTTRSQALRSAVLFLGRVEAGVLDRQETATLREEVRNVLGSDVLAAAETVLREAVAASDGDTATLLRLGQRLAALALEQPPAAPDPEPVDEEVARWEGEGGMLDHRIGSDQDGSDGGESDGSDQTGDAGEQDGDPSNTGDDPSEGEAERLPCGSWTGGDLPDDTDPWTDDTDDNGGGEGDQDEDAPAMTDAVRDTAAQVADDADRKAKAAAFPPPPNDPGEAEREHARGVTQAAYQRGFGHGTAPIRIMERAPGAGLQEQARRLTWALRRAQFRAVTRTRTPAAAPPGRMKMGEMMRRDAQKAARAKITAQPWKQTRRREAAQPPLTVGFSGDVSGSMGTWQEVTADLAWAVAQAVSHMAGTTAAVAWNSDVAPTLHPGQNPPRVQEAKCGGGSAGCALSLRALDGALHLTSERDGARAVVVVTDGDLRETYPKINGEVQRLTRTGVKVLWVTPWEDPRVHPSATNLVLSDPAAFGETVGKALADLLASA
ncbi:MAG: VWA domain-containing protein [Nocardioides sp.]|nr:VWA domain-containing protein [Nocardioides sp.]